MFKFPWSKPKQPQKPAEPWALTTPLLNLSNGDVFTVGQSFEGVLPLGATGSGKSSGSGRTLALSYLDAGYGGLVLCAKPDERDVWERYCRETGRSDDLIVFNPKNPWKFNFMDAELNRSGGGGGLTENLVRLMTTILEIPRKSGKGGAGGGENAEYFRQTNEQLCRNAIDLVSMAKGEVSIPSLYQIVVSAPASTEETKSEEWRKSSFCFQCLMQADKSQRTEIQDIDLGLVADYFLIKWPRLAEKTRSIIDSTFTSAVDVLNRGVLRQLFCGETNLTPQAVEDGKIIVIDMPVLEYGAVGHFAQILWKYSFQRHIERRDVKASPRPVFLWQDEAQLFLIENDFVFQTTCRAARVATVMLSQNVSNFYAVLGSDAAGKAQADSLFANLNLKIFHANGDPVTNQWAADLIGRSRQFMMNASHNHGSDDLFSTLGGGGSGQSSAGVSEQIQYEVEPSVFSQLRTGGPQNDFCVDAILFANGVTFKATGRRWRPVTFNQK